MEFIKIELGLARSTNKFPMNILALLINWLQEVDASHTYIGYRSLTGAKNYFDSTFWTVRDTLDSYFSKKYKVTRSYYCVEEIDPIEFMKWRESHRGKHYGMVQVGGLLLKIIGKSSKNLMRGDKSQMICNELCLDFCQKFLGTELSKNINDYDLDETFEIFEALVSMGCLHRGEI